MSNRYAGSPEEKRVLDTYVKLYRATQAVETAAHRHLARHHLTISQFAVLEALLHVGPLSQRQLADKILRSSGNLTMVIDNLERDGLVQRARSSNDRRVMIVSLTNSGLDLIQRVLPDHVRGLLQAFSVLSTEELTALGQISRKLGYGVKELERAGELSSSRFSRELMPT